MGVLFRVAYNATTNTLIRYTKLRDTLAMYQVQEIMGDKKHLCSFTWTREENGY